MRIVFAAVFALVPLVSLAALVTATAPPAAAQQVEKTIDQLLQAPSDSNAIDRLFQLSNELNDAILRKALASLSPDSLPTFGNGEQLIYEFSDYRCGYCRRMYPTLENAALTEGKIRVVLIELPVLGELSQTAARYALAAHEQGKFAAFHRYLMQNSARLSEQTLQDAVDATDMDTTALRDYLNSGKADKQLETNYKLAALVGTNATPTFIINEKIYRGALTEKDFSLLLEH